jgi:putative component of membrane protein insertase Oxa1/YidC/SpoIIIJ protein YidD
MIKIKKRVKIKYTYVIVFTSLFFLVDLYSQTDWEKWGKAELDYKFNDSFRSRDYSFDSDNAGKFILKSFVNAYWFFVSDVDGDNCPFRPSCSAFFYDAVNETNIFQGTLMFFDRFTRDLNIFKKGEYPRTREGYYYDPSFLYTLSKVDLLQPNEAVKFE